MNPSEIFLEERSQGAAGSTVVASMEGTRPILVEIQAIDFPDRFFQIQDEWQLALIIIGVSLLMAVLEKRVGLLIAKSRCILKGYWWGKAG